MMHSFLLIGQSNMAGRGELTDLPEISDPRLKVFRNGRWQPMYRPINADRPFAGINLAERFAQLYAETYDVEVGLICCADGGTTLEQWKPGSLLFDNAVNCAKLAQRTSTIAGVLWHQGEGDCIPEWYSTYAKRFEVMRAAFRKELDLYDVPFLVGALGDFLKDREVSPQLVNYPHINAQLQLAAASDPLTGYVCAEGLDHKGDNLHFSAKSLFTFGERYFELFQQLRDPNKVFEEKPNPDQAIRTDMEWM